MKCIFKIICAVLAILTALPCSMAFAGGDYDADMNANVVTEYYSDDLKEDVAVDAATIPVTTPPNINAESVILMEQSTGKVLYEKNADEKLPPASITKIMTMILICEAIDSGSLKMSDVVTTSEHASSMGGSQIWLKPNETMTVEELLKAVAIGSANDASVALAEKIAGSEESFVGMMNDKAKELNMKNTTFKNACGLDDDGHISTARDVAIISRELLKHNVIRRFTSTWMDSLRGGDTQLVNTNKLVRFYMGATGLKTGTTSKAGSCLSASAKRNNMELIAVVMKAADSKERFAGAKKLLDYGFANWSITTPKVDKSKMAEINVTKGQQDTLKLECEEISSELLSSREKSNIKTEIDLPESIEAPVSKGQQIGTLKIVNNGKVLHEYSIYAAHSVDKIDFGFVLQRLFNQLLKA